VGTRLVDAVAGLGLKIEKADVPQPVLAVESVNKRPTPNPPGMAESLPAPPTRAFEVATLKPCNDDHIVGVHFEAGGRVTATCVPVSGLIRQAWNLPLWVDPIGLPESMRSQSASIVAKASARVTPGRRQERGTGWSVSFSGAPLWSEDEARQHYSAWLFATGLLKWH
jgi:hypothetical protein